MKLTITTYLLCFTMAISLDLAAQTDTTQNAKTATNIENPYSKGKTKWLNSSGFNTTNYDWSDPAINLNLEKAINQRSASTILGITGAAAVVVGLYANLAQAFRDDPKTVKGPFYVGGALLATSFTFTLSSWSKVKKAEEARLKKFPK